jgi:serine/threonine protein kinase
VTLGHSSSFKTYCSCINISYIGEPYGVEVDIWSAGVTSIELACRSIPCVGLSENDFRNLKDINPIECIIYYEDPIVAALTVCYALSYHRITQNYKKTKG